MNRVLQNLRVLSALLMAAAFSVAAQAADITASACTVSAINAAIGSAALGDRVLIPAGSLSAADGAGITLNKNIILDGQGAVTITHTGSGSGSILTIQPTATAAPWGYGPRLTGIAFAEANTHSFSADTYIVGVDGQNYTRQRFRIDHCTFYSTLGSLTFVKVFGSAGLIDNCTMTAETSSEMIHNEGWGPVTTGWTNDYDPTDFTLALAVESCVFNKTNQGDQFFWGTCAIQSYYGARTIFWYNTLNYVSVDQHGTPGNIGARAGIYAYNVFHMPETGVCYPGGGNQSHFAALRAGFFLWYGNTLTGGPNQGTGSVSAFEEDTDAYPSLYQVGRGKNQALFPAYAWSNSAGLVPSGDGGLVQNGRDLFPNTMMPGYVEPIYPNPLRSADITAPTITSIVINPAGTTATVNFSEAVSNGAGGSGGWTISPSSGAATMTYGSGTGTASWTFNISRTLYSGETITAGYTQPTNGAEDAAGNDLATVSGVTVDNSQNTQHPAATATARIRRGLGFN